MSVRAEEMIELLMQYLTSYGINVLGAIVTLIVGYVAASWLARMTDGAMRKADKIDPVFHRLPGKIVRVGVLVITLIAVLNRFGVETTSLIAVLGVAAGVMLLFFRPFKIGDTVKLGSELFIIDAPGFFICKAHLPDGPTAYLPNSKIWGQTIINLSVTDRDMRRIDEYYSISYDDNIDTALAILARIAADEPRILEDPAPLIKVEKLSDSSVDILFRVWTARADWLATRLDLVKCCKEGLEAGGCTIPFPQRDVHLRQKAAKTAA